MARQQQTSSANSQVEIERHLATNRYGDFRLTGAIRPSLDLQVVPCQGYRIEVFTDHQSGSQIPMLAAAVSREVLFDTFLMLLDQLGDVVDAILESHHHCRDQNSRPQDYLREHIDLPILKSYCHEFRDVLLEDGCFGIAVVDPSGPSEVQFDDHKLLVIYAKNLEPFIAVMKEAGVVCDPALKLISEGEHLHSTSPLLEERAEAFRISMTAE